MKKITTHAILLIVAFSCFVFFNYFKAQKAIQETKPSEFAIDLVSYPESLSSGSWGSFVWSVDTPPDLTTSFTTIYWGNESSPSSLTKDDSPQAVGYPRHQSDYTSGVFRLPSQFDERIFFDNIGTVYFRAYSKVGSMHLWSSEFKVEVVNEK